MDLLLAHPDIDVNAQNNSGETALQSASAAGEVAMVRKLVAHPTCDPNLPSDGWRLTPLAAAVLGGQVEVVKLLLAQQAVSLDTDGSPSLEQLASQTNALGSNLPTVQIRFVRAENRIGHVRCGPRTGRRS
jgi:ankyrin repeat protein